MSGNGGKSATGYDIIQELVVEGFFNAPVTSKEVVRRIGERFSKRWTTSEVQPYLSKFLRDGVIHGLKLHGTAPNYWVLATVPRAEAIKLVSKGREVAELEQQLFSTSLTAKLSRNFEVELGELHDNFGKNGDSTAFLLRKILEKLLIIVFGKIGREALLSDHSRPGGFKGLEQSIEVAAKQKVDGLPLLTGKTANAIKGIKFLGDTAAHNPLVNVDVNTILPQMPFIITAYEELAIHL